MGSFPWLPPPGQLGLFPKTFSAQSPSLLDVSPALSGASRNIQVCPVPCHSSWELGALMSFLILFLFTLPPPALLAQGLLSCEMRNSLSSAWETDHPQDSLQPQSLLYFQ